MLSPSGSSSSPEMSFLSVSVLRGQGGRALWYTICLASLLLSQPAVAQLSYNFYKNTCPQVESTVRSTIGVNLLADPTALAALLRLAFHDCQVGGCDASIMLDSRGSITSEMVSDRNFGVRQLALIDRAKAAVDAQCGPGKVSCADIIALAGRDAVTMSGGPDFAIPLGRRDSTFASNRAADAALPPATISVDRLLSLFGSKGMSVEETVAILGGGHTLGAGHCVNIINRLYPTQDTRLSFVYATRLRVSCPVSDPRFILNTTAVQNDFTSLRFDNRYFQDVMNNLGLFSIDAELGLDSRTRPIASRFAQNQNEFFATFVRAYTKLTAANVLTGSSGQVRNNCRVVN